MMTHRLYKIQTWFLTTLFLTTVNLSLAAETCTAIKDDALRAAPFTDAKTTANIKRGEPLSILKKQGAWLQVKSAKSTGWLRLLAVKRTIAGNKIASNNVLNQDSGRSGTGQIVSTTGVRGLNDEELKMASFNEAEISSLESYTQTASAAEKFAKAGQLKTVAFANLMAPKPVAQSNHSQSLGGAK